MIELNFLRVASYCALGALLGAVHFSMLSLNVRLYAGSGPGFSAALLHLARLLLTATVLTLCARQGASPLLSSVVGFELVRKIAINQATLAFDGKA